MKKTRIPTAVFERVGERLGMTKAAIKIAIYRNNLTVIEAVKTEMDKLTAKIQADKLRAIEIKNTIYNKGGMLRHDTRKALTKIYSINNHYLRGENEEDHLGGNE